MKGDHFEDYKLSAELLKGIYEKGYDTPSPVQEEVIPVALERKNIIARAKNGTGKTGSFVIPILQLIKTNTNNNINSIQALILVPTRELTLQISSTVKEIGKYLNVQYGCKNVTTIKITSKYFKETYSYKLLSGPIESTTSYAQLLKDKGVLAGDLSTLNIIPKDKFNNDISSFLASSFLLLFILNNSCSS